MSGVPGGAMLPIPSPQHEEAAHPLEDISIPERVGAALLIGTTLLIGLYPRLLLDLIVPALQSPMLEKVMKAGKG